MSKRSQKLLTLDLTACGDGTYTGEEVPVRPGVLSLIAQAAFVRGAGGTTCDVFLQTSFDNGSTWADIGQWAFLTTTVTKLHGVRPSVALAANVTPTDGSLTDNTILDGALGDRVRVKAVVVGTYTGTSTLDVHMVQN